MYMMIYISLHTSSYCMLHAPGRPVIPCTGDSKADQSSEIEMASQAYEIFRGDAAVIFRARRLSRGGARYR